MIQHTILRAARVFKLYSTFFSIIISLSFFPHQYSYSQDYQKMTEINKKMLLVLAELDSCKNDLNCIQIVSKKLEKLTKELEAAQNTKTNNQNKNIPNNNNQIGGQTNIPIPPTNNQQPDLPPPFESITKIWTEHIIAANPKPFEEADCELINKTREKLLREISKVYEKQDSIKVWEYPITIFYCSKASVNIEEEGKINIPFAMKLKYKMHSEESPSWIVTYELFLDENNFRFGDRLNFKLWASVTTATAMGDYSGWIIDNSVDPPVSLPLDQVSFLSEKDVDPVWKLGLGGGDISYTYIQPFEYKSVGKNVNYLLWLHNEPVRFYPNGKPEFYVESLRGTIKENLTNEDILTALKQGEYDAYYNETDFTGTSNISKHVTIKFKTDKCDKSNSAGNGAIVLAGDCIDHGGEVITGNSGIYVNNKQIAYIGDKVMCRKHGLTKIIATKKIGVMSGDRQVARIGDKTECGATIIGGSKNTFAGIK
jgi:uncharacterized Zn-binding protein involved in type VI secretion